MEQEEITVHPLFVAYTQPAMKGGVPVGIFILNLFVGMMLFIWAHQFILGVVVFGVVYAVSYSFCKFYDHFFLEVAGRYLSLNLKSLTKPSARIMWGHKTFSPE